MDDARLLAITMQEIAEEPSGFTHQRNVTFPALLNTAGLATYYDAWLAEVVASELGDKGRSRGANKILERAVVTKLIGQGYVSIKINDPVRYFRLSLEGSSATTYSELVKGNKTAGELRTGHALANYPNPNSRLYPPLVNVSHTRLAHV